MKISFKRIDKIGSLTKEELRVRTRLLKRSGAYIRKIARDHVKHRSNPNEKSLPGHSPYDHFGLKKSIIFSVKDDSAYIGPRYVKGGLANVARLHEFGGKAVIKSAEGNLYDGVKIGDVAPVTIANVNSKDKIIRQETQKDPKTGRKVVWVKIRTKRQMLHSQRLYRRYSPLIATQKLVNYAPRPYMNPALIKSIPYLSSIWKNSIRN